MDTLGLGDRKDDDWMTDGTPPPSRGNLREPQAESEFILQTRLEKGHLVLEDARGVEVPTKALEPPKRTQVLETIRIELGRHETRHHQRFVN